MVHSTSELPPAAAMTFKLNETAGASKRSPYEPVLTRMLWMDWHCVVLPGTHTVTVVKRVLTLLPAGPPLTTTLATFELGVIGVLGVDSELPPPQDITERQTTNPQPWRSARISADLTADLRWTTRSESPAAGKRD